MLLYIRLIYTVINNLPAGIHRHNELKVIWIIFLLKSVLTLCSAILS